MEEEGWFDSSSSQNLKFIGTRNFYPTWAIWAWTNPLIPLQRTLNRDLMRRYRACRLSEVHSVLLACCQHLCPVPALWLQHGHDYGGEQSYTWTVTDVYSSRIIKHNWFHVWRVTIYWYWRVHWSLWVDATALSRQLGWGTIGSDESSIKPRMCNVPRVR